MGPFNAAAEKGRPAMQYIWDLQDRLRVLKADRRRFRALSFTLGFVAGCLAVWLLALVR